MSTILNEVFANFERFEDEQKALDKAEVDQSQFDLLHAEAELSGEAPRYLDASILVTADEKDILSEKKFPFGLETEDMVEKAHPETVVVADGPLSSGVVDNQNEQHQKIVNMVNKQPTGNVFHNFTFAEEVHELTAIANELDDRGLYTEADALTHVAGQLSQLKKKVAKRPATHIRGGTPTTPAGGPIVDPSVDPSRLGFLASLLGLGAGVRGVAGAAASRLPQLLGLFGTGAAALANPWVAGTAAVLAGIPLVISMYNGIQEDFNTDLGDLESAVKDSLEDAEDVNQSRLLNDMLNIIGKIRVQKNVLDTGAKDPKRIGTAISSIDALLKTLRQKINEFSAASGSWMPDLLSAFLSSLRDRMNNLEESWSDFMGSISAEAKRWAAEAAQSGALGQVVEPTAAKEREAPEKEEETPEQLSMRVRSMQSFLMRVPDSFWDKAGFEDVDALLQAGATGQLDDITSAALDAFANGISDDLGVSNLSGPRLEREGDGRKLRELWQVYKSPERYF